MNGEMTARSRSLVLAAMIFAVSMTFIDQTIVSIAAPHIQRELGLTNTGMQWAINAYLLALAALFAFGGRLADTMGHRRMVMLGVVIFAGSSAACGLTPTGSAAEAWIVAFRAVQGAGGAIMFPAALAAVVQTFPLQQRGRALALFFGIAGGLTAIGPVLGGFLTEWTWRAIFWVNIPVAIVAVVLTALSKTANVTRPAPIDYRGLVLVAGGVGLSVFGFQQSTVWGWHNPGIGLSIAAGVVLLVIFGYTEVSTRSPLIQLSIFRIRAFLVENVVLGVAMLVFGGRILDRRGAKPTVTFGCGLAAVGFYLWAGALTQLKLSSEVDYIIMAGAGMGLMLGPASTDAVNRASRFSYGEATGITQTVRNYAASLGLAILGTVLVSQMRSRVVTSLVAQGVPKAKASVEASRFSQSQSGSGSTASIPHFLRLDFAHATSTVFYAMAGIMAVAAVIALFGLQRGLQQEPAQAVGASTPAGTVSTTPGVSSAL